MPLSARVGDMWVGICCCHSDPTCISMVGTIVTGSPNASSNNSSQARLNDMTIGGCGHPGIIITGSGKEQTNNLPNARVGDLVMGCNIGVITTGNPTHTVG